MIDPDMIMRDSFADWGRMYGAGEATTCMRAPPSRMPLNAQQLLAGLRVQPRKAGPAVGYRTSADAIPVRPLCRARLGGQCALWVHAGRGQQLVRHARAPDTATPGRAGRYARITQPLCPLPGCRLPILPIFAVLLALSLRTNAGGPRRHAAAVPRLLPKPHAAPRHRCLARPPPPPLGRAGPRGRRGDQTSGVVLMQRDDLAAVAPLWLHYSEVPGRAETLGRALRACLTADG